MKTKKQNKQIEEDIRNYIDFQKGRVNFWRRIFLLCSFSALAVASYSLYLIIKVAGIVNTYCPK